MRAHDLETLEFPRVLQAIAALARSAAGRTAVLALRPLPSPAEAGARLDAVGELLALDAEAGALPAADVPLLAPLLAAAAPVGATLEPRRLSEVRDLLAVARRVRAFPALSLPAGGGSVIWDGRTQWGTAAAGLYFVRLSAEGRSLSQRLVRLR